MHCVALLYYVITRVIVVAVSVVVAIVVVKHFFLTFCVEFYQTSSQDLDLNYVVNVTE